MTLFGGQPPTNHHYFCCCCCRCSSHEPLDLCGRKGVKRWAVIESERPNRVKRSTPFFPLPCQGNSCDALGRDFEVSVSLRASVLGKKLGGVSELVQVFTVIHFFRPCLSTFSGHTTVIHFFRPCSKKLSGHCHIIINFFRSCPRTFLGHSVFRFFRPCLSLRALRSLCHKFLAAVSQNTQVTVS